MIWACREHLLDLNARPLLMGILNVTPDSFSDGGRYARADLAIVRGIEMVRQGADILDVGGESTRPGAAEVDPQTELRRVVPVIEGLKQHTTALISVDTRKAVVARAALEAGAHIINDVSAFTHDPEAMTRLALETGCGCILMHMRGTPSTMQQAPHYDNVVQEVADYLKDRVGVLLQAGIDKRQLAIDPGFGFGKTVDHNYTLLAHLPRLGGLGVPIVAGLSRKSMLGHVTGRPVADRLAASLAALICATERGANILRVHDVQESADALCVLHAVSS